MDELEVIILANKFDIEHQREVSDAEIKQFEKKFGYTVHLVSAKTGDNIEKVFSDLIEDLIKKEEIFT